MVHRLPTAPKSKYFGETNPAVTTGKVRRRTMLKCQHYPLHGNFTPSKK